MTSAPYIAGVSALYLSPRESKVLYLGVGRCYGHTKGTTGVSEVVIPCRGPPGASCWRGRPAREVHRNPTREECFPKIQPWCSVSPSGVVQGRRYPGTRCGPTLLQGLQRARCPRSPYNVDPTGNLGGSLPRPAPYRSSVSALCLSCRESKVPYLERGDPRRPPACTIGTSG